MVLLLVGFSTWLRVSLFKLGLRFGFVNLWLRLVLVLECLFVVFCLFALYLRGL